MNPFQLWLSQLEWNYSNNVYCKVFSDISPNIPFTLIYGNKTLEKTMFYNELKNLEDRFETLKIYWFFSEEKIDG